MLKKWEELPEFMKTEEVKVYYDMLSKKKGALVLKRAFDLVVSFIMLLVLSPVFLLIAVAIKLDSPGPVFFRQVRVTQYGEEFRIFKFRSMVNNADKIGSAVTTKGDARITKVGKFIRKFRLDEFCQLIDIFRGTMSFVGTRPEVPKYVNAYTDEMNATLLLKAGVTSEASIRFKDEDKILEGKSDIDRAYIEEVLPKKMEYNLEAIRNFSFFGEIGIMIRTVFAVLK
ncbi:MAG: sugar transferase [Clostridia bacterium]|nr:sugar transferase [Clostridia bacterium]